MAGQLLLLQCIQPLADRQLFHPAQSFHSLASRPTALSDHPRSALGKQHDRLRTLNRYIGVEHSISHSQKNINPARRNFGIHRSGTRKEGNSRNQNTKYLSHAAFYHHGHFHSLIKGRRQGPILLQSGVLRRIVDGTSHKLSSYGASSQQNQILAH